MGLSLAGPLASVFGLRAVRLFACVDPVFHSSGFSYCACIDGGLCRCTGAVSCGRRHLPFWVAGRHAGVECMFACACSAWPGRAGRPLGRVLVRLTFPLEAWSLCFAWLPPGWGYPFPVLFFCLPPFLLGLFFSSLSSRPSCLLLILFSGRGCPGPWRCVAPPPSDSSSPGFPCGLLGLVYVSANPPPLFRLFVPWAVVPRLGLL